MKMQSEAEIKCGYTYDASKGREWANSVYDKGVYNELSKPLYRSNVEFLKSTLDKK